jgi:hypothetical protein
MLPAAMKYAKSAAESAPVPTANRNLLPTGTF